MSFKFENLRVWQKSLDLSKEIDILTKTFPSNEKFVLTDQIRRATDSISLNIAEGSTNQSYAEFKRFLTYSIRSNIEVVGCLHLGKRRNIITSLYFDKLYKQ
jgi:four helix bundle protein